MDLTSNLFKQNLLNGYLSGKTFKLMIMNPNFNPSPNDQYVADIVANEISDPSYSRPTIVLSAALTNNKVNVTFPDTDIFLDGPIDTRYAVIYNEVTDDSDSVIVRVLEHRNSNGTVSTFTTENGNLTIKSPVGGGVITLEDG